jgi:hypothetical protein
LRHAEIIFESVTGVRVVVVVVVIVVVVVVVVVVVEVVVVVVVVVVVAVCGPNSCESYVCLRRNRWIYDLYGFCPVFYSHVTT